MILEQIENYGSTMAFYVEQEGTFTFSDGSKHKHFGLGVNENQIPSWQLKRMSRPAGMTILLRDMQTNTVTPLSAGFLNLVKSFQSTTGDYWLRYNTGAGTAGLNLCGFYRLEIQLDNNKTPVAISEVFHAQPRSQKENCYRMRIASTYDIDNLLMQGDYYEEFYFEGSLVFPEVETVQESYLDGGNNLTVSSSATKLIGVMEMYDIPDYLVTALTKLPEHETVTIEKMQTGEVFDILEPRFTTQPQDVGFQTGVLRFVKANTVHAGCNTSKSVNEIAIN